MNVDLGGVRTSLLGEAGYRQAMVAWLIPRRPDRGRAPAEVVFMLKDQPAPAPDEAADVVFGPLGLWLDGDRIRAHGPNGLGGQLDLSTRRGAVNAPAIGDDRFRWAIHFGLRPLWHLALGRAGRHLVHAAGVVVDDVHLLIVGLSGSGKSTLAVELALQGGALLTDDATYLDETATNAYSTGERARLHPDQCERFGLDGRRSVDEKLLVDVPDRVSSMRPERLVFLDPGTTECRPCSAEEAMSGLIPAMPFGVDRVGDHTRMAVAAALARTVPALTIPARPGPEQIKALRAMVRTDHGVQRTA